MKILHLILHAVGRAASAETGRLRFGKLLLLLTGLLVHTVQAAPPTDWHWVLPSRIEFYADVAHGNGTFVGVRGYGEVATSPDGWNWTPVESSTFDFFQTVAFGGGIFVAGGGDEIHISTNGLQWDRHPAPGESDFVSLSQIRFLEGLFVAIGEKALGNGTTAGVLYTSTNGVQWIQRLQVIPPNGGNVYLTGLAAGNGRFVMVGEQFDSSFELEPLTYTSLDSAQWVRTVPSPVLSFSSGIAFAGSKFVLLDGHRLLTSPDGIAWEVAHELEEMDEADGWWLWNGIASIGNRIVCIAEWNTGEFPRLALSSDDGISWQQTPLPPTAPGDYTPRLFAGGGLFLNVGERSALSSSNGIAWTENFTPHPLDADTPNLRDVAYGGEGFVAVGANGTILGSRDGLFWQRRESGTERNLTDVIYGGGRYVAAGEGGTLIYSTNGIAWTQADLEGNTLSLGPLAYGAGRFVLLTRVGRNGFFWTSEDAVNWQLRFSDALIFFNGANSMVFGNGRFVVMGDEVAISEDGITWQSSVVPGSSHTLIFDGDRFLSQTYGFSNSLRSSLDGLTWMEIPNYLISAIGYGDGNLVAVRAIEENNDNFGDPIFLLESSLDGVSWTTVAPFRFGGLYLKFAYGSGRFVGVGGTFDETARLLVSGFIPPLALPRLDLRRESSQLMLRISGNAGSQWNLQRSSTLQEWETVAPVTLGTEPIEIDVTPTTESRGFWRLSTP